ncbi:multidrug ABC transporter ATPase [Agromyces sp. H3Y2-19a]|uniref:multidrug ABC transporter ATPase n=1 Tax=Agromyces TaxID=33877 RepID=UPI001E283482|nr:MULTISPECIES: multidrug ABC transporter ATPase [Agromyces]MCD5346439.1 multidrug ABC transporter ATPase [Agromyces sp. S2-1-8]MDF0512803.1 multidrug ABC transporter ATPase [Agromyces chromiiresistens]
MSDSGPITEHRAERVLAVMFAAIIGCSIVAFFAVIIGSAAGAAANDGFSQGIWPFVIMFPWFGLPIAFVLLITLLIVNAVRRSRETRAGSS